MLSEPRNPADPRQQPPAPAPADTAAEPGEAGEGMQEEVGGRGGLDPVRYGDWEKNGRCIDF